MILPDKTFYRIFVPKASPVKIFHYLVFFSIALALLFAACKEEDTDEAGYSLRSYIKDNGDPVIQMDSILAYATESIPSFMENTGDPISVFYLPPENSTEYIMFESDKYSINVNDLTTFYEIALESRTEYDGAFVRFLHPALEFPRWARISCKKNGQILISNAFLINTMSDSTKYCPGLVEIDFDQLTQPLFSWYNDSIPGTSMYLQIVATADQEMLSGTFTTDQYFQFYVLDNVIRNIHDVSPSPVLTKGQTYSFTVLGMGADYWVEMVSDSTFHIP